MILNKAYEVFASRYSPSVQRTLFETGEAILESASEVRKVALQMPNVHFLNLDLNRFDRPNNMTLFLPTDEPHGEIQAVVTR